MFEDCGRKLKVVAVLFFVLQLLGTVVGFVFATKTDVLIALGVLLGGALWSYLSALVLYTIGEAGDKEQRKNREEKKNQKIDKILDALCDN